MTRKKRVRVHLKDDALPSIEGLLISRRHDEYVVALPKLIVDATQVPAELAARLLAIPKANVAFYEII